LTSVLLDQNQLQLFFLRFVVVFGGEKLERLRKHKQFIALGLIMLILRGTAVLSRAVAEFGGGLLRNVGAVLR
jgi:hypothetical protein